DRIPARRKVGREEAGDEAPAARNALRDAAPVDVRGAEGERQVEREADAEAPAQQRALDEGWLLPAPRAGGELGHQVFPAMRSRSSTAARWSGARASSSAASSGSSSSSSSTLRMVA